MEMTFNVLNALISQGQVQASARKRELLQLQNIFSQIPIHTSRITSELNSIQASQPFDNALDESHLQNQEIAIGSVLDAGQIDYEFLDEAIWRTAFTADQLMNVADNLDLDGLEWMTTVSSSLPD